MSMVYHNGRYVESKHELIRGKVKNWFRQWLEEDGIRISGYCYYHKLHGGTFIYNDLKTKNFNE